MKMFWFKKDGTITDVPPKVDYIFLHEYTTKCPKDEYDLEFSNFVFTSNPPIYVAKCPHCGQVYRIRGEGGFSATFTELKSKPKPKPRSKEAIVVVAQGKDAAQYVKATGKIHRSTKNAISKNIEFDYDYGDENK